MKNISNIWKNYYDNRPQGPEEAAVYASAKKIADQWVDEDYPKKQEFWKYVNFNRIEKLDLNLEKDHQSKNFCKVSNSKIQISINNFSQSQSFEIENLPAGFNVLSPSQIFSKKSSVEDFFSTSFDKENLFSICAKSFWNLGLFLVLEDGLVLDKPVHIDFNLPKTANMFVPFYVQVILGAGCDAKIYVTTNGKDFSGISNISVDGELGENSNLKFFSREQGGESSYFLNHLQMRCHKNARLESFDLTLPGCWSRHNIKAQLLDEGAETTLQGAYLNRKNYFCDHHTEIQHNKKNTTSFQKYKGILSDTTKAVFNGRVFIDKGAKGSNSEQINKNLLLSRKAEIDTKPELQIYNDDVKAAHGATVGQLDQDQMFYLQSRGFSKDRAWRTLSRAFIFDFFEDMDDQSKDFFVNSINSELAQFQGTHNEF